MRDYQRQDIRNRLVSGPGARISLGETCRYLLVAAALSALVIAYPWVHSEILSLGYQIEQLKRENTLLQEQRQALMLEQAAYRSPQRIDQYARERLGLIPANSAYVILIQDTEDLPSRQILAESVVPGVIQSKETHR
ncbi:MAG: cell division protein FtsL [Acidobacteria bacterium]|nr:cell division protein FtsL [Acidobacteriota bacterium]